MRTAITTLLLVLFSLPLSIEPLWAGDETIVEGIIVDGEQLSPLSNVLVYAKRADMVDAPQVDLLTTGLDGHFRVNSIAALGHEHFDAPIYIYFVVKGDTKVIPPVLRRPQDRKSCTRREIIVPTGALADSPPEESWLSGHRSADGRTLYLRAFVNGGSTEKPEGEHPANDYRWILNGYLSRLSESNRFYVEPIGVEPLPPDFAWQSRPWRYYETRLNALAIATGEMETDGGHESKVDVHSRFIVMPFIDGFRGFEDEDWRWVEAKAVGTIKMYRQFFDFWNFQTLLSIALYEARSALARCQVDGYGTPESMLCPSRSNFAPVLQRGASVTATIRLANQATVVCRGESTIYWTSLTRGWSNSPIPIRSNYSDEDRGYCVGGISLGGKRLGICNGGPICNRRWA
jgi:hypothetical protein